MNVFANEGYPKRSAILTVTNTNGCEVQISKIQDGLSYGSLHFVATGETKVIIYESGISVEQCPSWIEVRDIGAGEIEIIARENESYERTGSVVLRGSNLLTIAVTQDAGEDADISKKFQITPMALYYESTGGSQYIQITNNNGNNWRVTSKPSWVTISQSQGSGSAIINVGASSNDGASARTDNIVIYNATNERTYLVVCNQASAGSETGRTITINPNPATIGYEGGEIMVQITYTNRNGDFLIPATSGVTVGDIKFTGETATVRIIVPENTSFNSKQYEIIFNGDNISAALTINQDAAVPYLEVDPDSITFGKDGGEANIRITTNDNWTIQ